MKETTLPLAPLPPLRAYLWAALGILTALAFESPPIQAAVTEAWVHRYHNVVYPAAAFASKVVCDAAGDIIVAGSTENGGSYDMLTIKYSGADGSMLWQRRHNGPGNGFDTPAAVAVDGSGNVVVTGTSYNGTNADYYTAKYAAADGAQLWEQRYNGLANDRDVAVAVALDYSGNAVVTGHSDGTNGHTALWNGHADFYTAKYAAADGALIWAQRYDGPANSEDVAVAVAVDGGGNVVVTGFSDNARTFYDHDYYTAKYAAADGALLWEQRYNGPLNDDDFASAVAVDRHGNVVVTGSSYGTNITIDIYTAKYSAADGTLVWETRDNGVGSLAAALAVDGAGNAVVTGTVPNGTNYNYYTAKYAMADGALVWDQRYRGPENNYSFAPAMAVDGNGNVVMTGWSNLNGSADYYTAKFAAADGALLWEKRYNGSGDGDDRASSLALGPDGMVAVSGTSSGDYATVVYRENLPPISVALRSPGIGLRFTGVPGRSYAIERAAAVTGSWSTINTQTAPASGLVEYVDTPPPAGSAFYRTVQP